MPSVQHLLRKLEDKLDRINHPPKPSATRAPTFALQKWIDLLQGKIWTNYPPHQIRNEAARQAGDTIATSMCMEAFILFAFAIFRTDLSAEETTTFISEFRLWWRRVQSSTALQALTAKMREEFELDKLMLVCAKRETARSEKRVGGMRKHRYRYNTAVLTESRRDTPSPIRPIIETV